MDIEEYMPKVNQHHIYDSLKDPLQAESLYLVLRKIFCKRSYFCVIDFAKFVEMANPNLRSGRSARESLESISHLHCIDYSEMSPSMLQYIVDNLVEAWVTTSIGSLGKDPSLDVERRVAVEFINRSICPKTTRPDGVEEFVRNLSSASSKAEGRDSPSDFTTNSEPVVKENKVLSLFKRRK